MEQFSNADYHDNDDHDTLFEDDPSAAAIFQIRSLPQNFPEIPSFFTDSQMLFGSQVDADSSINNESDPISQMLKNLEKSVINEKDEEISILKSELKEKNKETVQIKENLTKLVDYITFVHGEFAMLLRGMIAIELKDETNILRLGPFKNETVKNKFVQNLSGLSINCMRDYENFKCTKDVFAKINTILSSTRNVTKKQSANNIFPMNINPVHSDKTNGDITCASSVNQVITLPPPSNLTKLSPPTSCMTHSVNIFSEDLNFRTTHEAPRQNFTEAFSQSSSSSNMTIEPPPSPLNLTMRRPPPSISRNSLQADYGINLTTANKKHGIDHSKGHWGFFCLCNTRFNSIAKLKDHVKYFTMRNFECIICKNRYHRSRLLKLHMISSHKIAVVGNETLTCSICHGKFINWNILRDHLENIHGIEKRHTSIKTNRFTRDSTKHAPDASVVSPHSCTCGKIYSNKNGLISHLRVYMYGKVFKCSWCSDTFYYLKDLNVHASKIHGMEKDKQNQFGCSKCGETFRLFAELKIHRVDVQCTKHITIS